MKTSSLSILI